MNLAEREIAIRFGWSVRAGNRNPLDNTRPFGNFEIVQPDGELCDLRHPDGTRFDEIMSVDEAWEIICEFMFRAIS